MEDDKTCAMSLNACKVVDPGLFKARDGLPGQKGDKGEIGAQGLKGAYGRRGYRGFMGEQGLQGPKGDKGDNGEDGPVGVEGFGGTMGIHGMPGYTGEKGHRGPSGLPGKNGVCYQKCTRISESGEELPDLGTKENPSDALCNIQRNYRKPFTGKIWVNPHDKFEVECKEGWTCLLTEYKDVEYIEKAAFHPPENQNTGFWLSKFDFDLSKFYGVNMKQMALLQQRSKQVTQKIRYHCKNSYVMENPETALRLLSANDVVIGPHASDFNPIAYAILTNDTHGCTKGASKSDWLYSDITVRGNAKKLPVIDFFINDNRMEDQSFFLESVELCFG